MSSPSIHDRVAGRVLHFCPDLDRIPLKERHTTCSFCGACVLRCCECLIDTKEGFHCGTRILAFTDGACLRNGAIDAAAGIGVYMGTSPDDQLSAPVTEAIDGNSRRTSQRAELLAAILGVEALQTRNAQHMHAKPRDTSHRETTVLAVLATDSQYVFDGMTDWIHNWRQNGRMYGPVRDQPKNLDLFLKLEDAVLALESEGVDFGFWKVPRNENMEADRLAAQGARSASY